MKNSDKTKHITCAEFYDSLRSPFIDIDDRHSYGDGKTDCRPEYIAEELCKSLIDLYQRLSLENNQFQSSQGNIKELSFSRVTVTVVTVLSHQSNRALAMR